MKSDAEKTEAIARAMAIGHGFDPDKAYKMETAESRAVYYDYAWQFFYPDALKLYYGLKAVVDLKILAPAMSDIAASVLREVANAKPDIDDANLRDYMQEKQDRAAVPDRKAKK
jgi:hypothetical protein